MQVGKGRIPNLCNLLHSRPVNQFVHQQYNGPKQVTVTVTLQPQSTQKRCKSTCSV